MAKPRIGYWNIRGVNSRFQNQ